MKVLENSWKAVETFNCSSCSHNFLALPGASPNFRYELEISIAWCALPNYHAQKTKQGNLLGSRRNRLHIFQFLNSFIRKKAYPWQQFSFPLGTTFHTMYKEDGNACRKFWKDPLRGTKILFCGRGLWAFVGVVLVTKTAFLTPKMYDEHPRPFYMGVLPRGNFPDT